MQFRCYKWNTTGFFSKFSLFFCCLFSTISWNNSATKSPFQRDASNITSENNAQNQMPYCLFYTQYSTRKYLSNMLFKIENDQDLNPCFSIKLFNFTHLVVIGAIPKSILYYAMPSKTLLSRQFLERTHNTTLSSKNNLLTWFQLPQVQPFFRSLKNR